jgi:hypothetical protein
MYVNRLYTFWLPLYLSDCEGVAYTQAATRCQSTNHRPPGASVEQKQIAEQRGNGGPAIIIHAQTVTERNVILN